MGSGKNFRNPGLCQDFSFLNVHDCKVNSNNSFSGWFQAACFTAMGFIFMSMSLTFIIIDWTTGEKRAGGGH